MIADEGAHEFCFKVWASRPRSLATHDPGPKRPMFQRHTLYIFIDRGVAYHEQTQSLLTSIVTMKDG
jgi:hypothetical protein